MTDFLDTIFGGAVDFVFAVVRVVEDPAAHRAQAALIAAMAAVLIFILILLALLFLPSKKRMLRKIEGEWDDDENETAHPDSGEGDAASSEIAEGDGPTPDKSSGGKRALLLATGIAVLFAALLSAWVVTSGDAFCADLCHQDISATLRDTPTHASVSCAACHSRGGAVHIAVDRMRWVATEFGMALPREARVDGGACLSCHAGVLDGPLSSGSIRMSHTEPLEAGLPCDRCHADTGHTVVRVSLGSQMSVCIRCHDGERAAQACDVCHIGDPASVESGARVFGKTALTQDRDCGGCHSQTSCDRCHGLRLPHSAEFVDGGHARLGAFESGERLCRRCHTNEDCGAACHQMPWGAHSDGWRVEHQGAPSNSPCACHALRGGRDGTEPFCILCHAENGSLLAPLPR